MKVKKSTSRDIQYRRESRPRYAKSYDQNAKAMYVMWRGVVFMMSDSMRSNRGIHQAHPRVLEPCARVWSSHPS